MLSSYYLELEEVLYQIKEALEKKQPYSLVRIGDGENIVLAQDSVMSMNDVLNERWAKNANNNRKGVTLPNITLRDSMVEAIRQANVVGILPYHDTDIKAPDHLKRDLTDQILSYYGINPKFICHACVNRQLVEEPLFWTILKGRRILLIYQSINELKHILQSEPLKLNVTVAIAFSHYRQMDDTLKLIKKNKNNYDIALICCGVNAVVLAQKVAELAGKVGIDFGKASNILIKGSPN